MGRLSSGSAGRGPVCLLWSWSHPVGWGWGGRRGRGQPGVVRWGDWAPCGEQGGPFSDGFTDVGGFLRAVRRGACPAEGARRSDLLKAVAVANLAAEAAPRDRDQSHPARQSSAATAAAVVCMPGPAQQLPTKGKGDMEPAGTGAASSETTSKGPLALHITHRPVLPSPGCQRKQRWWQEGSEEHPAPPCWVSDRLALAGGSSGAPCAAPGTSCPCRHAGAAGFGAGTLPCPVLTMLLHVRFAECLHNSSEIQIRARAWQSRQRLPGAGLVWGLEKKKRRRKRREGSTSSPPGASGGSLAAGCGWLSPCLFWPWG